MSIVRGLVIAFSSLALAACAAAAPKANPTLAQEQRAADAFKARYPAVIMGEDVHDRTLTFYVDVNGLYSLDPQTQDEMQTRALADWKRAWKRAHPHRHAILRLSLRDYYGKEIYAAATRV